MQHTFALKLVLIGFGSLLCHGIDLYRADSRAPSVIEAGGGFKPKGQSVVGVVSPDISLWNHVHGAPSGSSKDDDGYVSTTWDPSLAESWVSRFLGGNGYIYRIHSAPNMIDCQSTLGHYNPYPDEKEFAAIGGIKYDQIISWTPVTNRRKGNEQSNPFFKSNIYSNMGNGGSQPKLAAFPAGHPAWNEAPWKSFSTCSNPKRAVRDLLRRGCGPAKSNQAYAQDYINYAQALCPEC